MHQVIVLVPGYAEWMEHGRQRAGGTVTLIKGRPNLIVDTGAAHQKTLILDALTQHGVQPADIEFVINTHGHLDHIGNNNLFPHATFYLDQDVSRDGDYWVHDFKMGAIHIESSDGGPSIEVLSTPGHADHDLSVIVRAETGTVAIVGDLFEHEGDWRDKSWEYWSRNQEQQRESRDRILKIADYIVPGHGAMFAAPA